MAASITDGTTTIHPDLVLGYRSTRQAGSTVHEILDGSIAVSLRQAGLRAGKLALFFVTETDAAAAEQLHTVAARFTLTEPDRTTIGMQYAVVGEISRELDKDTRDRWVVEIGFQEVTA